MFVHSTEPLVRCFRNFHYSYYAFLGGDVSSPVVNCLHASWKCRLEKVWLCQCRSSVFCCQCWVQVYSLVLWLWISQGYNYKQFVHDSSSSTVLDQILLHSLVEMSCYLLWVQTGTVPWEYWPSRYRRTKWCLSSGMLLLCCYGVGPSPMIFNSKSRMGVQLPLWQWQNGEPWQ